MISQGSDESLFPLLKFVLRPTQNQVQDVSQPNHKDLADAAVSHYMYLTIFHLHVSGCPQQGSVMSCLSNITVTLKTFVNSFKPTFCGVDLM